MFKSKWFSVIIICITFLCFIFPIIRGYSKTSYISNKIVVEDIKLSNNSSDNGNINILLKRPMSVKLNYEYIVKESNDTILIGQDQVLASTLGNYVVQILISPGVKSPDLNALVNELMTSNTFSSNTLINSVKVSYPSDEDLIAVYIGCNYKPEVSTYSGFSSIKVKLNKLN